jgi:glycosyltransferase involved in cell wall biosynthesis
VCSYALFEQAGRLAPSILSKAKVIHNGVDKKLFGNVDPYKHDKPYILAIGQLEEHKGFDILLDSFANLHTQFPAYDLIIAGSGSQSRILQTKILASSMQTKIHLLGSVKPNNVASLMRGSELIVIPSRREPYGIVAQEAMASGKPIVASKAGGLPEALAGYGVEWADPGDSISLSKAIARQVSRLDTSTIQSTKKGCRAAIRSWDCVASEYIQVYEEVMT